MRKTVAVPAWLLALVACQSTPMTPQQRELLAADISDAISAVRVAAPEEAKPYLDVLDPLILAFVASDTGFDFDAAFAALAAAEPQLKAALIKSGLDEPQAELAMVTIRILLRRVAWEVVSGEEIRPNG